MRILLACSGGYSSSLLVSKIIEAGKAKGLEIQCKAVSITEAIDINKDWDVVLLGPQVKYLASSLRERSKVPIMDILPQDYALAKGDRVLEMVLNSKGGKNE